LFIALLAHAERSFDLERERINTGLIK